MTIEELIEDLKFRRKNDELIRKVGETATLRIERIEELLFKLVEKTNEN